ncbi:MAG: transposase [Anaerolineae bacterium]
MGRRDSLEVKSSRRQWGAHGENPKHYKEYFFGYKTNCSLNAESELVTSVIGTPANALDRRQLPALLERDLAQGFPVTIVAADRAYHDGHNHFLLQSKGAHSAIRLNDCRTKKKDPNKDIRLQLRDSPQHQVGLRER